MCLPETIASLPLQNTDNGAIIIIHSGGTTHLHAVAIMRPLEERTTVLDETVACLLQVGRHRL